MLRRCSSLTLADSPPAVLFALLLAPIAAQRAGSSRELVAEGPAPPGGEVELAIHMRTSAGLARLLAQPRRRRPADGRRLAAAQGLRRRPAALPGADPADHRRADELRLRARLCGARAAEGAGGRARHASRSAPMRTGSPAPTRSACPSRASCRSTCRSAAARRNRAQFDEWRRALPRPLATLGHFAVAGDKLRVAIPLPASVDGRRALSLPDHRRRPSIMPRRRRFRRAGDTLVAELEAQGRGRRRHSPACSRSATGAASSSARSRAGAERRHAPIGGLGAERRPVGGARRDSSAGSCST